MLKKILYPLINTLVILISLGISSNIVSATTNYQTQIDDPLGSLDRFNQNLEKIGITYTQLDKNVEITVDELKTLNQLPRLQSEGIVSKLDSEIINIAPLSVSVVVVGVSSTITILNSCFERDNLLDEVQVQGYVIPIGNTNKKLCYSFKHNRKKFKMLDLSILTPRKFISNTPTFTFSDWCKINIDNEATNLKN